jgi:hypothetical protein
MPYKMGRKDILMDNKNNNTTNATGNTAPTPAPQQDDESMKELMKMKAAYATFEAENRKNRTFGEKFVESLPYLVSGLALGASAVAIGASIKALDTTKKVLEEQRAIPTTWSPSPDGDLE